MRQLFNDAHVPFTEMQKLRLCVEAAKVNPAHLDMGMPAANVSTIAPELAAAMSALPPVTEGLASNELKPRGLKGGELFDHMVRFRTQHEAELQVPSFIDDLTQDQQVVIKPTLQDLTVRSILRDAGGSGASKKLAQRKLNNSGAITNHCGLQNQPERIKKLKDALELTASLAEISAGAKQEKTKLKAKETSCLLGSADAAMQKFLSNGKDLGKLCKTEICAISFRYFGVQLKESVTKGTLVSSLQGLITSQPDVLSAQISSAGAEVNGQAEMAAAEIGSDNDFEVESDCGFSSE